MQPPFRYFCYTFCMIRHVTVKRLGHGPSDRIRFVVISDGPVSDETMVDLQTKRGKHPGGYGMPMDAERLNYPGITIATWTCAASAD